VANSLDANATKQQVVKAIAPLVSTVPNIEKMGALNHRAPHPRIGRYSSKCPVWREPRRLLNPGRQGRTYFSRNALGDAGRISGDKGIYQQESVRPNAAPFIAGIH
jgi:hypothetical protein